MAAKTQEIDLIDDDILFNKKHSLGIGTVYSWNRANRENDRFR